MTTKEEYEAYMKNLADAEKTPTSKEFPFDLISKKISFLEMFCGVIDKHPEDLEESYRKTHEERNAKPSGTLIDYFLLNIAMFYESAKNKFNLEEKQMPETYKRVKTFRNKIMAHFDEDIKTNAEVVKEYIVVNDQDGKGFDRIWLDYVSFRDKIFERIKNQNLLIYQKQIKDSYLYLIKENIKLMKVLLLEETKLFNIENQEESVFYASRAKHFQIMNLIGSTAEHLIKIVLLKRGFVLNERTSNPKFSSLFMDKLNRINWSSMNQQEMDKLYHEAEKDIKSSFDDRLINLGKSIALFNQSISADYFLNIDEYLLNPHPEIYNAGEYMGYKIIKPSQCFNVIQKSRNNYTHLLESHKEQNGVIWYLINFLIWVSKKEYADFFKEVEYVGSDENKSLFKEIKNGS